jgi:ubiquinone/menaquinone biosynthesis C-methylase UbiE
MEDPLAKTIHTYDLIAEEYAGTTKDLPVGHRFLKGFMAKLPRGAEVLDVGCGPGRDAKILADKGFIVTGIDLSKNMIDIARSAAPGARFEVMDFRKISFEDHSFDAVWFNMALFHVPKADARVVIDGLHRIIKPSGSLFMSVKQGVGEGMEEDPRYGSQERFYSYYSNSDVSDLLEQSGFRIRKIQVVPPEDLYDLHPIIGVFAVKGA